MTLDTFETSRAQGEPIDLYLIQGADPATENAVRAVVLGPGTGEYALGTTRVVTPGGAPLNEYGGQDKADFVVSLDQLQATLPNLERVSLMVAWHGNDLRMGACEIKPKVSAAGLASAPYQWRVGPLGAVAAEVLTTSGGMPAFGGAPSDRTIYEAIREIRTRGMKVMLHPVIYMDIPAGNTKPNPYGGTGQATYPRRRDITCNPAPGLAGTVDKTADVLPQLANFFGSVAASSFGWNATGRYVEYSGSATEWSYRRFILHMARIAAAAGGIDDFLLGSDLYGVTTVRNAAGYPAVDRLITLAADVRGMLGATTRISYGAGWVEGHCHRASDGDVAFHLDLLWANANVDFVGLLDYLPLSDWREGSTHLDRAEGWTSPYELDYLRRRIESGENFDWTYASSGARDTQTRTPIADATYGKPWVFRDKDLRSWWTQQHFNRPGGVESATPTAWVPGSKPIVFVEFGCPAVDKGTNLPGAVYNPPASLLRPYYSSGTPDDSVQRAYLDAMLSYWPAQSPESGSLRMVDAASMFAFQWDVRPYPTFPRNTTLWRDAHYYDTSHALNGRLRPGEALLLGTFGPYAFTNAETPVVRDGVTYQPVPIKSSAIESSGTLDKSTLSLTIGSGFNAAFDDEFTASNPETVVNLTIRHGHLGDDPDDPLAFLVTWAGRVLGASRANRSKVLTCEPISTTMKRPGLRVNFQRGCQHVLYGPDCRANRSVATKTAIVSTIAANGTITFSATLPGPALPQKYVGGLASWIDANGGRVLRTIASVPATNAVRIRGLTDGLAIGQDVQLTLGCAHTVEDCRNVHSNILNYGGQPDIPLENPAGTRNEYF